MTDLNKNPVWAICSFAPEAEGRILNYQKCLLADFSLADFSKSFPTSFVDKENQTLACLTLNNWMLTANYGPSAISCFIDEVDDCIVDYVAWQTEEIDVLDCPIDQLIRKFGFFDCLGTSCYLF